MARPLNKGLKYFPLDTDIDQDDAVYFIESKYGLSGFAILIKLFIRIYHNSYYTVMDDKQLLMFQKRTGAGVNVTETLINDAVTEGLFDAELYKKYRVLTSIGIQQRFFEITKRNVRVKHIPELLLIKPSLKNLEIDTKNRQIIVNVTETNVNVTETNVNATFSTQIKLKENKLKETKEKKRQLPLKKFSPDSEPYRLSLLLFTKSVNNNDLSKLKTLNNTDKEKTLQRWSKDMDSLIRIDKQSHINIEKVIIFVTASDFWKSNILSGEKLRLQWDTVSSQMQGGNNNNGRQNGRTQNRVSRDTEQSEYEKHY